MTLEMFSSWSARVIHSCCTWSGWSSAYCSVISSRFCVFCVIFVAVVRETASHRRFDWRLGAHLEDELEVGLVVGFVQVAVEALEPGNEEAQQLPLAPRLAHLEPPHHLDGEVAHHVRVLVGQQLRQLVLAPAVGHVEERVDGQRRIPDILGHHQLQQLDGIPPQRDRLVARLFGDDRRRR